MPRAARAPRAGPLGHFDLDESETAPPVCEQIIAALTANAGKVLDLFASWDADGSGLIEVNELQRLLRRGQTMELDVSVASARQIQEQARARAAAG